MTVSPEPIPADSFWPWALDVLVDFGRRWAALQRQQVAVPADSMRPSIPASADLTSTPTETVSAWFDLGEFSGDSTTVPAHQAAFQGKVVTQLASE